MKKLFLMLLACVLLVVSACFAHAETTYAPGVTVEVASEADKAGEYGAAYSAAGYKVTFVYENKDENIDKVYVGGGIQFYDPSEVKTYLTAEDGEYTHGDGYNTSTLGPDATVRTALEYEAGFFPAGFDVLMGDYFNAKIKNGSRSDIDVSMMGNLLYELVETEEGSGIYQGSIPLAANQYFYKFFIYNKDGSNTSIYDPTNLPYVNGDSDPGWSYTYVGNGETASEEQKYIFPREDGKAGKVEYVTYTGIDGTEQPLSIYTPYGYDASKVYKTIYLSHGGGGNETEWFQLGAAGNIMDNLIAEGLTEEAIVVCMDHTYFWRNVKSDDVYATCRENLQNCIVPYVEANYSVSKVAEDRALVGLSRGGRTVSNMYIKDPDYFKYYGMFSGVECSIDITEWDVEAMSKAIVFTSAGNVDFGLGYYGQDPKTDTRNAYTVVEFNTLMDNAGVPYSFKLVQGAHDWYIWRAGFSAFVKDIAWSAE